MVCPFVSQLRFDSLTARYASTHRPFLIVPETFPQGPLQDLARAALRQLGLRELDAAGNLVVGEKPPAMDDQFVRAKSLSRLPYNAGRDEFAPLWVGYAEDRRFENRRMLVNDGFDLAGVDVFAARDDHVLQAVENVEIAVGVAIADVSRTEHSVLERAARFLRIIPVAAHDIGAARHQFTMLPGFNLPAQLVHDPHVDPGTGSPTRHEPGLRVLMVLQAGEKARLAQAVTLNQLDVRQNLSRAADKPGPPGSAAVDQGLQAGQVELLELRELGEQIDHRRHQHGTADALA